MRPDKLRNELPDRVLARCSIDLARVHSELVPAFVWLVATGARSDRVKAFRKAPPTDDELAALVAYIGPPVREILSHKKRLLSRVEAIDVAKQGVLRICVKALQRLGLGIEYMIWK